MSAKLAEIKAAVAEFHPKLEELPEWEAQIYTIKFAVVSCIWLTDLIAIAEAAQRFSDCYATLEMGSSGGPELRALDEALAKLEGEAQS